MRGSSDKDKRSATRSIGAKQLLSLITPLFGVHRKRLIIGFSALLCVDLLQLTIPRILKRGVDGLATFTISQAELAKLALIILAIAIVVGFLRFIWRNLIIGFSRLLEQNIRERIFSHVVKMDVPFFEQRTTGAIMAHISNDLSAVQMACGMGMVAAIDGFVVSIVAIFFMMHIDVKLTLLALMPMPFLAVFTRILSSKLHKRFSTVQEEFGRLTEFSRSTLVSIKLIKAYAMESFQAKSFDSLGKDYVRSNLRVALIQGLIFPIATLVGNVGLLLVLYYGGLLVIEESITIGDFVAFTTYLYMLIWPMMAVGWVANLVQRGLTSLDRIYKLLAAKPVLTDDIVASKDEKFAPRFTLESLTFSYPRSEVQVLKNISLSIEPGLLGITGPTGSGKSSLCKLLSRLYPVPDGTLFLDRTDVNDIALTSVREMIGYVGQEPILFSTTIFENIKFGRPDATREDAERCAKLAGIHEDILQFSKGYDTEIGERGVTLSGGQRQRLALARALICDRPILLIDDGLSAIDVETEHHVLTELKKHLQGKTVIIVSHRIKLLSMTDRIVVIDEGEIAIEGTHNELLETNSFYMAMHEKQVREAKRSQGGLK